LVAATINMSFYVHKDIRRDNIRADQTFTLPIMVGSAFPPNIQESIGGGLLYNNNTKTPYYNDGTQWLPLGGGGPGGNVDTYCLLKDGDISIPDGVVTILTLWDSTTVPYHDQTSQWDISTGVYTAIQAQFLMITANISWSPNESTIGTRTLQIIYKPAAGVPMVAKSSITQPNPDIAIQTPQDATATLRLAPGDQAWLRVSQNSGALLSIMGGAETVITGFESL
jgi:hypothetical protein